MAMLIYNSTNKTFVLSRMNWIEMIFIRRFSEKVTCAFNVCRNNGEIMRIKYSSCHKNDVIFHIFNLTVVNQELTFLRVVSLEITLTIPLIIILLKNRFEGW